MVRTMVMNECMTAIKRRKRQIQVMQSGVFVEPASAEIFLTPWKIPQKCPLVVVLGLSFLLSQDLRLNCFGSYRLQVVSGDF